MIREEKQKAIDAVERLNALKQFIGYDEDSEIVQATQKSLDMAIKALEQRWIPCSERLPDIPDGEDWVRCLCYGEKEITPDHIDDPNTVTSIEIVAYFRRYGWDGWFHPIAWMPLPSPYKVESEK